MNALKPEFDLPKLLLGAFFIILMILACFAIVKPFILGFAWAAMVVIATWPLMRRIENLLWGKRSLAVAVMTLMLLLVFVIPFAMVITSLVENRADIMALFSSAGDVPLPDLEGLKAIPMVGERLYAGWHNMISGDFGQLATKVQPYLGKSAGWLLSQAVNVGHFFFHCALMLLFSALLFYKGEFVAQGMRHFAVRLAGERGDTAVILASQAIRAVALGVVVTALVQAILGAIGLTFANVPYITLLMLLMFVCCVAQLGPLLVLIPAVIYLYWTGDHNLAASLLLIWSIAIASLDNVLRPFLIKLGADLPMILILSGVIGGLLSFGLIGLFLGPVILAVSYRLVSVWVDEVPQPIDSIDGGSK